MGRAFTTASAISLLLLFVALAALWPLSYQLEPTPGSISGIMPDGYVLGRGVRILAFDGDISLYNQGIPYSGSIISFSPNWPRTAGLTFPGIYFRHMTWPGEFPGGTYWTLTFSIAYPLLLTSFAPAAWAGMRIRRRYRDKRGCCPSCSYNLTGNTSGVCPECGTPVPQKSVTAA